MTLDELYKAKGELVTQIEVAQAKLQAVNQELIKLLNEPPTEKPERLFPKE